MCQRAEARRSRVHSISGHFQRTAAEVQFKKKFIGGQLRAAVSDFGCAWMLGWVALGNGCHIGNMTGHVNSPVVRPLPLPRSDTAT